MCAFFGDNQIKPWVARFQVCNEIKLKRHYYDRTANIQGKEAQ